MSRVCVRVVCQSVTHRRITPTNAYTHPSTHKHWHKHPPYPPPPPTTPQHTHASISLPWHTHPPTYTRIHPYPPPPPPRQTSPAMLYGSKGKLALSLSLWLSLSLSVWKGTESETVGLDWSGYPKLTDVFKFMAENPQYNRLHFLSCRSSQHWRESSLQGDCGLHLQRERERARDRERDRERQGETDRQTERMAAIAFKTAV